MVKQGQLKFDVILVEAVQEGLRSISPAVSEVVLFHLQKQAAIRIDEHVIDADAFDDGLQKIFGCGAKVIEKRILECLYLKLEAPQKINSDFKFAVEVKRAQKLLDSDCRITAKAIQ